FLDKHFPTVEVESDEITLPEIPKNIGNAKTIMNTIKKGFTKKVTSKELRKYDANYLKELYIEVLNRSINRLEFDKWMNTLDQKSSRIGIYRGLVSSREYELKNDELNEKMINFVSLYFKKFLNKSIPLDSIAKVGFRTVKKIAVEQTLEIIDVLMLKGEDYNKWYGIFSEFLAVDFSAVWISEFRKNKSARYHVSWSKAVPFVYGKSEIVIKLHRLMNWLQQNNY
ncbi:DUF4214 domain-containing protein, partial [Bacteriovoracaceae bacterium]|nr:DUF4214 domain-containing protein [Bacteriovoracaceae bacterium]